MVDLGVGEVPVADDLDALRAEYDQKSSLYDRFCGELEKQIGELLRQEGVALAVPIEKRVKPWESIADKCQRSKVVPGVLQDIGDVAGLRIILLFRRDQERVCQLIKTNFDVLDVEDALERLSADQFGYGSVHFDVRPKKEWFSLPTLHGLEGLRAEIQVRTASQHIWAAASHILQYKRESHVPKPLRRALNRAAALLETVDLEFERVLGDREAYVAQLEEPAGHQPLNIDIVERILAEELPPENARPGGEPLADLLDDLLACNIRDAESFRSLLRKHRDAVLANDRDVVAHINAAQREKLDPERRRRLDRGVYFIHVGLARQALKLEIGDQRFHEYTRTKRRRSTR